MTTSALPKYRTVGAIFSLALLCCYLLGAFLFQQPVHALILVLPMLLIFISTLVPMFLDQHGVEYRIEGDGVRLVRCGKTRKFIPFHRIKSVRFQQDTLILRMHGFWSGSQLLHPAFHATEFMRELENKICRLENPP